MTKSTLTTNRAANRASRFLGGDDRLSRLATALLNEAVALDAAATEVRHLYAPAECMDLAAKGAAVKVRTILATYGFTTLDAAIEALERRTSGRFVYFAGFGALEAR